MKYALQFDNHKTFKIFEKNKLAPRAYFIPYSSEETLKKTDFRKERYESDLVQVLSGDWEFKFYKQKSKMPPVLDTKKVKFDKVHVPSVWQREGHYQEPVYLNCPYEFKSMPPDVPEDMPCGVYRKTFTLSDVGATRYITFLGVANNLDLYINGNHVGYSEGSHNTAEFDITPYLQKGENELIATCFKWCNGSFLEAQDFFRENGIFRDVYVTTQPEAFLDDFKVSTPKTEAGYDLLLSVAVAGEVENCKVKAALMRGGAVVCAAEAPVAEEVGFSFPALDVLEWNAEEPNLYELFITLEKGDAALMSLRSFTGFKTVLIDGEMFYFNDAKIKVKGVNHHDTHPVRGYAMTLEDLEIDVKLMKSLNVNAARTSHYPPDPFFLTLADYYGLYIVDEADIETHGLRDLGLSSTLISHDPKWAKHYVDRVKRMYFRDRNHPCLLMWSLGNEAKGYKCQDACYKYLKEETDTTLPVHYEGVIGTKRHSYDVISEMYTDIPTIRAMAQHKRLHKETGRLDKRYHGKPFFLCEYAHAMGVGPGCLEEYWETLYSADQLMGGCIWEWADHTVFHGEDDKKYKYRYTYGGDHGEKQHDGNFCVDGLIYADRTPHTGALEMQAVYRPVRARRIDGNLYEFENTNRFRNAEYIRAEWALLENGEEIDVGALPKLDIAPVSSKEITIPHKEIGDEKDYHLNIKYFDGEHLLAFEQLTLFDTEYEYEFEIGEKISAESADNVITVRFDGGTACLSLEDGALFSYKKGDTEYFNQTPAGRFRGFGPNIWRAFLDNDLIRREWFEKGLDKLNYEVADITVELEAETVNIYCLYELKKGKKVVYRVDVNHTVWASGAIDVTANLEVADDELAMVDLARFGVTLELDKAFDTVRYYGRGEAENLPDFNAQAPVGIYEAKVADIHEPYVYPQDNGNHTDTKWLTLTNEQGEGLSIYAYDKLSFSAHNYTQETLQDAKHQEDLCDQNTTFLSLDGFVRGAGSKSCGPDTLDKYRKDASTEELEVAFTIVPIK
ncbi:MAG: DUF4981 domain-containing protein [Oscillospiraceae bacterium]|jgi:beta-galactosidase|nr:DUF4981 domain-containing protein [Oscillospiraceae bacterium]